MASSRGRWRWWCGSRCRSMLMVVVVLATSLCCVCTWVCSGSGNGSGSRGCTVLLRLDFGRRTEASRVNQEFSSASGEQRHRRRLLWSYPPRCYTKCGSCSPCYPVHVAVPPGVPVTTEYYPEAWRCKCGNRLYLP